MDSSTLLGHPSYSQETAQGVQHAVPLDAYQATIAAATIAARRCVRNEYVQGLSIQVGTTGSAGSTTVQVHRNGVAISGAELTIANTDANGSNAELVIDQKFNAGDVMEIVVSAAPTAGADLIASVDSVQRFDAEVAS